MPSPGASRRPTSPRSFRCAPGGRPAPHCRLRGAAGTSSTVAADRRGRQRPRSTFLEVSDEVQQARGSCERHRIPRPKRPSWSGDSQEATRVSVEPQGGSGRTVIRTRDLLHVRQTMGCDSYRLAGSCRSRQVMWCARLAGSSWRVWSCEWSHLGSYRRIVATPDLPAANSSRRPTRQHRVGSHSARSSRRSSRRWDSASEARLHRLRRGLREVRFAERPLVHGWSGDSPNASAFFSKVLEEPLLRPLARLDRNVVGASRSKRREERDSDRAAAPRRDGVAPPAAPDPCELEDLDGMGSTR